MFVSCASLLVEATEWHKATKKTTCLLLGYLPVKAGNPHGSNINGQDHMRKIFLNYSLIP